MGQTEITNVLRHSFSFSELSLKPNIVYLNFNYLSKIIRLPFRSHSTIGFVISELNRISKVNNIISLSSQSSIETLDYYLTFYENTIDKIPAQEIYNPIQSIWTNNQLSIRSYTPVKLIGKGGFSQVTLVRKKDTGKLYALKTTEKKSIRQKNRSDQIITEQRILLTHSHPFIVTLYSCFQTKDYLHLILEFCPGGDLFNLLQSAEVLTEDQAKFYFAEIVLALEHLHSNGVLYRDLKPENVLIGIDGHVKLTDFGLSKDELHENELNYTFCGSAEYMSPEMVEKTGYGTAVDVYALGALLYEMLVGNPPFYNEDPQYMFFKIKNEKLTFPEHLSAEVKDLLACLLDKDQKTRLGNKYVSDLKDHEWCASIHWKKVIKKKLKPPFVPSLDSSNFSAEFTSISVNQSIFMQETISPHPNDNFFRYENKVSDLNKKYLDQSLCGMTNDVSVTELRATNSCDFFEDYFVEQFDFSNKVSPPRTSIKAKTLLFKSSLEETRLKPFGNIKSMKSLLREKFKINH